jgi:hypothetical protein
MSLSDADAGSQRIIAVYAMKIFRKSLFRLSFSLLLYTCMWIPTFRRNMLPPSTGLKGSVPVNTEVSSVNMQHTYTIQPHVYPNQFSTELGPALSNLKVGTPYVSEMLVSTRRQNPQDLRKKIYVFINNGEHRRARLKRHHFMRHLIYNVKYSVVPK